MPSGRPGFTLAELVVAAFVFAVGILALEATAVSALRRMHRSAQLGLAASVARSRMEASIGMRCADLKSGSDSVRFVISLWTIEPTASPSVRALSQTITYRLDGAERTDTYRTMVPCGE